MLRAAPLAENQGEGRLPACEPLERCEGIAGKPGPARPGRPEAPRDLLESPDA